MLLLQVSQLSNPLYSFLKLTTFLNISHCFCARFSVYTSGEHILGLGLRGSLAVGCPMAFYQWEAPVGDQRMGRSWNQGNPEKHSALGLAEFTQGKTCGVPLHTDICSNSGNHCLSQSLRVPRGGGYMLLLPPSSRLFLAGFLNAAHILVNDPFIKLSSITQFDCAICFLLDMWWV